MGERERKGRTSGWGWERDGEWWLGGVGEEGTRERVEREGVDGTHREAGMGNVDEC